MDDLKMLLFRDRFVEKSGQACVTVTRGWYEKRVYNWKRVYAWETK